MKIPFLSGLKVNGKVELNNLSLLSSPTKILTIDSNNNITYSTSVGGTIDLSNYYDKSQTDSNISNAIANLVSSAPTTLDTLNELAAALGNDPNFATTVTNLIGTKANSSDVYTKLVSDSRYKAIAWLPNWTDIQSRPISLSQFSNDLGNYGNWITQTQANGWYQPVENQRLSTFNNVSFNQITANNKLSIPSTSSNKYSLYVDENGLGGTGATIPIIGYLNDLNDVTISTATSGQTLIYNGAQWINSVIPSGTFNYNDLINKPTQLSQFTNNLGNYGNFAYSNGSNAIGTWTIDIAGSADTAGSAGYATTAGEAFTAEYAFDAGNAQKWNNYQLDFTNYGSSLGNWLGYDNTSGKIMPFNAGQVRDALSLPNLGNIHNSIGFAGGYPSANANTVAENTSSFSYANNAPFNGALAHFGNGGYGLQLNGEYGGNRLAFRNRNGDTATWNAWKEIVNDGFARTWDLNISGSASQWNETPFTAGNIPNTPYFITLNSSATNAGYSSLGQVSASLGVNNGSTLNNNISGSAETWKGNSFDGSFVLGSAATYIMAYDGGNWRAGSVSSIKTTLGLPTSGIYDLQWITSNGNVTSNNISAEQFIAKGRILANKNGGDGTDWTNAHLEIQGANAGIAFHYPSQYAASLFMNASGILNWQGAAFSTNGFFSASSFIAGQRIISGYDSGVEGSVNASGWFRSIGNSGWYNTSYGGGIYMFDSEWIRTFNQKGFYVDGNTGILADGAIVSNLLLTSPTVRATSSIQLPVKNSSGVATGNHFSIWVEG